MARVKQKLTRVKKEQSKRLWTKVANNGIWFRIKYRKSEVILDYFR